MILVLREEVARANTICQLRGVLHPIGMWLALLDGELE
jgi:hypothetical protein